MESFNKYVVNLSHLKFNYKQIKNCVGKNVKVCAMVKANAYGHGLKDVCKALSGADFFGVANVIEAKQIRKFNKTTPILIVGVVNVLALDWCSENNVSVIASSVIELGNFVYILYGKKIKIHIKVNTGFNRIGVKSIKEFKQMLKLFKTNKNLILEGVFTHFATKQNNIEFLLDQHSKFNDFVKCVKCKNVIIHAANSFATLMFSSCHHNMVRCGFNLYGWQTDALKSFKPVLSISSKLVFINKIKAGEAVGYDCTFVAPKNMVVGVVPIGYADGFDRRLSNNFKVLINGQFAPVIGNVCMDVFMVDLTDLKCAVGDEVVLLGKSGKLELKPADYAKALNTSAYEILLKFKYDRMKKVLIK